MFWESAGIKSLCSIVLLYRFLLWVRGFSDLSHHPELCDCCSVVWWLDFRACHWTPPPPTLQHRHPPLRLPAPSMRMAPFPWHYYASAAFTVNSVQMEIDRVVKRMKIERWSREREREGDRVRCGEKRMTENKIKKNKEGLLSSDVAPRPELDRTMCRRLSDRIWVSTWHLLPGATTGGTNTRGVFFPWPWNPLCCLCWYFDISDHMVHRWAEEHKQTDVRSH